MFKFILGLPVRVGILQNTILRDHINSEIPNRVTATRFTIWLLLFSLCCHKNDLGYFLYTKCWTCPRAGASNYCFWSRLRMSIPIWCFTLLSTRWGLFQQWMEQTLDQVLLVDDRSARRWYWIIFGQGIPWKIRRSELIDLSGRSLDKAQECHHREPISRNIMHLRNETENCQHYQSPTFLDIPIEASLLHPLRCNRPEMQIFPLPRSEISFSIFGTIPVKHFECMGRDHLAPYRC